MPETNEQDIAQAVLEEEPQEAPESDFEPAPEEPAESRTRELEEELGRVRDQMLRQAAEFQNYRRRTNRERAEWTRRAQAPVLEAMLAVLDDFGRSLEASPSDGASPSAFEAGINLVYENLTAALARFGVEAVEAVGQPFDENLHEAVLRVPVPDGSEPGHVLQEVQRGYRHGEQVLRHAKVVVAAQMESR